MLAFLRQVPQMKPRYQRQSTDEDSAQVYYQIDSDMQWNATLRSEYVPESLNTAYQKKIEGSINVRKGLEEIC